MFCISWFALQFRIHLELFKVSYSLDSLRLANVILHNFYYYLTFSLSIFLLVNDWKLLVAWAIYVLLTLCCIIFTITLRYFTISIRSILRYLKFLYVATFRRHQLYLLPVIITVRKVYLPPHIIIILRYMKGTFVYL